MRDGPRLSGRKSKLIDRIGVNALQDEQARYNTASVKADEKFRELLTRAHNDRFVENTALKPGTERPRFSPHRPGFMPSASPAQLAADIGGSGGSGW